MGFYKLAQRENMNETERWISASKSISNQWTFVFIPDIPSPPALPLKWNFEIGSWRFKTASAGKGMIKSDFQYLWNHWPVISCGSSLRPSFVLFSNNLFWYFLAWPNSNHRKFLKALERSFKHEVSGHSSFIFIATAKQWETSHPRIAHGQRYLMPCLE